ncbi:PD-(D/E)XK nuclease family protein [Desertifilum sp. FACHB-1129]|uniref:PD-(D/E)XK nuclease superfamily protein n=1 Tax=Desertifilum tharense IPPAS B-1220 TaxID=1781255 RepID=A0A1E5QQG3_9CYAN|nr:MULTISPECIES: PD-(D/E)XK nuclease family protein [Desertifilum]MDA0209199.1 PD-(D/E)XK nuclease family protein [Cyanobacteria bacterium FC1]MBD2311853.1 PD-(D/E)XK nuclease family protein [Desertifilum sp. FACHB-1129]MBD2322997.1 PD-(D/E)XK nuclease family protein [Desertifilum sp. FACHB-866]MBD2333428.1 PD-(D/E)XK nuclease family protein [Desertifilum sp. FACHB-868]OEJ76837.1 PD-(D/E)XK nuclease superfamily protein [Desertifilum tharense IPPAS B-1220]
MSYLHLSQGQLNLLQTCPRKFQQTFIDQLSTPMSPEQQDSMNWGSRFHLLMQQRELGLPIEGLLQDDPQLAQCWLAFQEVAPGVFEAGKSSRLRESEHRRTLNFQGYLLTVVYDLLVLEDEDAAILDWKTYLHPKGRSWLARDWQTRLYPFVLVETSDYLPEQVSMTYWFVRSQSAQGATLAPQKEVFHYCDRQHQQTYADLTTLLRQLTHWLDRYEATGEPFPQVAETEGICPRCGFNLRCQRHQAEQMDWLNLEEIQELAL